MPAQTEASSRSKRIGEDNLGVGRCSGLTAPTSSPVEPLVSVITARVDCWGPHASPERVAVHGWHDIDQLENVLVVLGGIDKAREVQEWRRRRVVLLKE